MASNRLFPKTPRLGSTSSTRPTGRSSTGLAKGAIPLELLSQARSRLAVLSLVMAVLFELLATILVLLLKVFEIDLDYHPPSPWLAGAASALSLLTFGITRIKKIQPQTMCDIGLIYVVCIAFSMSFARNTFIVDPSALPTGISTSCVIILIFPFIVPNTLKKTIVAGLAAAAMEPLSILAHGALGDVTPNFFPAIARIVPTFICAALAIVSARLMYKMGHDMAKAKEMGSYKLVELLGQGGMGEVWRAKHRMLARPAAIKLVRSDAFGSPSQAQKAMRRFEREAKTTALLQSPHTVSIFDFGRTQEGSFFYVMELLDGVDLENFVERFGPQSSERVVHMLLQVCDSLIDAHARGLIHRDIKPANIYVCRYGQKTDFVKVLDFGLVKLVEDMGTTETKLTAEGSIAGTPAYMAPELAMGEAEVDGRVDIYALGCVAFWMLTGQLVFAADNPMKMVVAHLQQEPTPPSRTSEHEVPEQLDQLIMDCLAKKPQHRPQDARELQQRLKAIELIGGWDDDRSQRWWANHLPAGETRATGGGASGKRINPLDPLEVEDTMTVSRVDM